MGTVEIEIDDLTNRQLHLLLVDLLVEQAAHNNRLEVFMSSLTESVSAMQAAVDNIAVRFASQNQVLTDALENAQTALADSEIEEGEAKTALEEALAEAQSAADSINADVTELNSIGAAPDVPVEPVPVEELPPPPSEEPPPPAEGGPPQEIPPNEGNAVTPG